MFLLLKAQDYDPQTLRKLLPDDEFHSAIATLETISAKTEDKVMYDQRERAQRDYEWGLSGAREEGREEGRLIGQIQLLQELLGEQLLSDEELRTRDRESLTAELARLQNDLRERGFK